MSGDYKYAMQMRAEEIAEERFGCEFYSLTPEQQYKVFDDAATDWSERQFSKVDSLSEI